MSDFFKKVIEERFVSKKQQKYFYAKANDESLPKKERNKWKKYADEFSSKTNFKKLPDEAKEEEVDEIVDEKGDIARSGMPTNFNSKETTQDPWVTSDRAAKEGGKAMGIYGVAGTIQTPMAFRGETDFSKVLGGDDVVLKDMNYAQAMKYLTDKKNGPGLDERGADERARAFGLIPGEKELLNIIENPKKYTEDYIQSRINGGKIGDDIIKKDIGDDIGDKPQLNPIISKQLQSLKNSLENNNLTIDDIINYLKDEQ